MRIASRIALVVLVLYAAGVAGMFAVMRQPPDTFGRVMSRVPMPAFLVIPFKPMWLAARAGPLRPGNPAPDFSLETLDRKSSVQLSSYRGQKPVVLVFGSYT